MVLSLPVMAAQGTTPPGAQRTVTVVPADAARPSRTFTVALLAATPAERVRGLQGSRALLPGEAALFDFDPPQQVSFWMATLSYAIDIIYIDASGVVTEVFPDCQPESQEIFSSTRPVRWVLETASGSGIRVGDRVRTGRP
jgi:uncharacterized membrane protein (UPF0127 family)